MNNNPGAPVTGNDHHNRIIEMEYLLENANNNVHTNLSAARRTGKTSIMRELIRHLKLQGWCAVEIDFSGCKTMPEFMALFQQKVQAATKENSPLRAKLKSGFESVGAFFNRPLSVKYEGVETTLGTPKKNRRIATGNGNCLYNDR